MSQATAVGLACSPVASVWSALGHPRWPFLERQHPATLARDRPLHKTIRQQPQAGPCLGDHTCRSPQQCGPAPLARGGDRLHGRDLRRRSPPQRGLAPMSGASPTGLTTAVSLPPPQATSGQPPYAREYIWSCLMFRRAAVSLGPALRLVVPNSLATSGQEAVSRCVCDAKFRRTFVSNGNRWASSAPSKSAVAVSFLRGLAVELSMVCP